MSERFCVCKRKGVWGSESFKIVFVCRKAVVVPRTAIFNQINIKAERRFTQRISYVVIHRTTYVACLFACGDSFDSVTFQPFIFHKSTFDQNYSTDVTKQYRRHRCALFTSYSNVCKKWCCTGRL